MTDFIVALEQSVFILDSILPSDRKYWLDMMCAGRVNQAMKFIETNYPHLLDECKRIYENHIGDYKKEFMESLPGGEQ